MSDDKLNICLQHIVNATQELTQAIEIMGYQLQYEKNNECVMNLMKAVDILTTVHARLQSN